MEKVSVLITDLTSVSMTRLAKTLFNLLKCYPSRFVLNRPGNTHDLAGRYEQVLASPSN